MFRQQEILFEGSLKVGSTFATQHPLNEYKLVRILNTQNYMAFTDNAIVSATQTLMCGLLINVSVDDVMVLMDFAAETTNGTNYTVIRNTQVNIGRSGIVLFNPDITSTWRIIGLK